MIVRVFLPLAVVASLLAPRPGNSQTAPANPPSASTASEPPTTLTVLTQPGTAWLRFDGASHIQGPSPLELPPSFQGRFSLIVEGPNASRSQGVLYVPPRGIPAKLLSEPRSISAGLLIRSLSYPGLPDITAKRHLRGGVLMVAATGGLVMAGISHFEYRDRLDRFGAQAADEALDERKARNSWVKFAGATWAVSAVDYWIRPRLAVVESNPSRVTLSVPTISRSGILWRSALIPGAGQDFANQRVRGALWLGAGLAAAAGFVVADGMVERDQTDADWAEAYLDSSGPAELTVRLRDLEVARNDLHSSEDLRRGFRYAMIGVYLAGLVDALLVPTHSPAAVPESRVSTMILPVTPNGPAVQVTLRF
jgi:hypothetical protein